MTMQVMIAGSVVSTEVVTVSATAPGIFTVNQTGSGAGSILGEDYQVVSQNAPTHPGAFLSIYCTGLGAVTGVILEGNAAPNPPLNVVIVPQVSIGNIAARVTFAGLAPGFAGLYQINVQVPGGVQTGSSVPVVLSSGGVSSNTVTIVVQ